MFFKGGLTSVTSQSDESIATACRGCAREEQAMSSLLAASGLEGIFWQDLQSRTVVN